jgi:hypothetical protein
MSLAARIQSKTLAAIEKVGQSGTLTIPGATYNTDGSVTESATSVTVTLGGPVTDQKRYAETGADTRVTATFYVSASGLTVTPTVASRITASGRTFSCYACEPFTVEGTVVAYQMDCGEVGT